jgi:hypothetical protein
MKYTAAESRARRASEPCEGGLTTTGGRRGPESARKVIIVGALLDTSTQWLLNRACLCLRLHMHTARLVTRVAATRAMNVAMPAQIDISIYGPRDEIHASHTGCIFKFAAGFEVRQRAPVSASTDGFESAPRMIDLTGSPDREGVPLPNVRWYLGSTVPCRVRPGLLASGCCILRDLVTGKAEAPLRPVEKKRKARESDDVFLVDAEEAPPGPSTAQPLEGDTDLAVVADHARVWKTQAFYYATITLPLAISVEPLRGLLDVALTVALSALCRILTEISRTAASPAPCTFLTRSHLEPTARSVRRCAAWPASGKARRAKPCAEAKPCAAVLLCCLRQVGVRVSAVGGWVLTRSPLQRQGSKHSEEAPPSATTAGIPMGESCSGTHSACEVMDQSTYSEVWSGWALRAWKLLV